MQTRVTHKSIVRSGLPLAFLFFVATASAQLAQCKAVLKGDTLTLENSKVVRSFRWNDGDLRSIGLLNKSTGLVITGTDTGGKADVYFPGVAEKGRSGSFKTYPVAATGSSHPYVAAEVVASFGSMELKRVFKLYPDCPAVACDYYLRGKAGAWKAPPTETEAFKNIEDEITRRRSEEQAVVGDRLVLGGAHWKLKAVEFFDVTDYNNNLVQEYNRLLYRQDLRLRGNLLFASKALGGDGFFVLKEAPVSSVQLYYPGYDFSARWGHVKCAGLGVAPTDLSDTAWTRGYSVVVGIGEGPGDGGLQSALRSYQATQRVYKEERDAMIVANTWGDRNRDSRVNAAFVLKEIEAAAKLGITHLQIDDGWQTGRSSNSATAGGTLTGIWQMPGYWNVDETKFPGGFDTVLAAAKKHNIRLTLWFNPSTDSSFANWEKDAGVLIAQYKRWGIRQWKIDGVQAADKKAQNNFRKFLDKVMEATAHEAVFNLDVTAGRRFGYHSLHEYGNLFLENRYTDWGNYYPHFTLRNLWQLAKYFPPQRLQIEFLNKWRNGTKYAADDVLAPEAYSFDYLFATTMMAQPLAWFEVTGLPQEAFATSKLINLYKTIAKDLHAGKIFPIGDEPSGFGWTGFQSVQAARGYFLVFREAGQNSLKRMATHLPAGKKISLKKIAGGGRSFTAVTGEEGSLLFRLGTVKSFALYEYRLL